MFETGNVFLDLFLMFILILKLTNIFLTLFQKLLIKSQIMNESQIIGIFDYLQNIIILSMSILLIILFKPFGDDINLTKHIKLFLFTFGILQIIQFINNKKILKINYELN